MQHNSSYNKAEQNQTYRTQPIQIHGQHKFSNSCKMINQIFRIKITINFIIYWE